MARGGLPPATSSIPLPYVYFAASKVSSHLAENFSAWRRWAEGEFSVLPALKCVHSFTWSAKERTQWVAQSRRAEPGHVPIADLVSAVLGDPPADLCKVLDRSRYKGQWDLSLLSLVLLNSSGGRREGCHFSTASCLVLLYASQLTFTDCFVKTPSLISKLDPISWKTLLFWFCITWFVRGLNGSTRSSALEGEAHYRSCIVHNLHKFE